MHSEGLRNLKGVVSDIVEGFITVNPLYLKGLRNEEIKALYELIVRKQQEIRTETISISDIASIRGKNMRLQRVQTALNTITHYLRTKKIPILKDNKKKLKDIGI
ncbi:MAG: hypothetical protein SNJ53_05870 [Thermodesulfovibrionales bacterium]